MRIEDSIKNCELYVKQIRLFEPDPYYVKFFLKKYLTSVNDVIDGIFGEGNINFGLFISGKITKKKFFEKAKSKNDLDAIEFVKWFSKKYTEEHKNSYPSFIKKILQFNDGHGKLPKFKIKMRSVDKYKDDINQEIILNLRQGKIHSKQDIEIEIRRNLPIFLEIVNNKRNKRGEPKVKKSQVIASTFLEIEDYSDIEIVYAVKIYLNVLKRIVQESRRKMDELTRWK